MCTNVIVCLEDLYNYSKSQLENVIVMGVISLSHHHHPRLLRGGQR